MAEKQEGISTTFKQCVVPCKLLFLKRDQSGNGNVLIETSKPPPVIRIHEMDLSCGGKMYKCFLCNFWSSSTDEIMKHFLPKHSGVTELELETSKTLEQDKFLTALALSPNEFKNLQMRGCKLSLGTSSVISSNGQKQLSTEETFNMSSIFHWSYIKMKFNNKFIFHCVWCDYFDTCSHDFSGIPNILFEHVKTCHFSSFNIIKMVPITVKPNDVNLEHPKQYFSL